MKLLSLISRRLGFLVVKILQPFINKNYVGIYRRGRRVGNTTRLIDMFVQDFFDKGICRVYDHHNTQEANLRVFGLVLERLYREHGIDKNHVLLDRNKYVIRLIKHADKVHKTDR